MYKKSKKLGTQWKWAVWVGGVEDYYCDYNDAQNAYKKWTSQGYDDVILEELTND